MMTTATREALLAELATLCGLACQYYDIAGTLHQTTASTQEALLAAMGCRTQSMADLQEEVARRRQWPWSALVEPVLALNQADLPASWPLYLPLDGEVLPADLEITWELFDEQGSCCHRHRVIGPLRLQASRHFPDAAYGQVALPLPSDLPMGYYRLQVQAQVGATPRQGEMLVVIAPTQVYVPEVLTRQRLWGINLPLYALASNRNWGIGDCGDLQRSIALAGKLGADCLGLNPLHHLGPHLEDSISPYYPTSRCFPEPLYLDLEQVPELAVCRPAQEYLASAAVQEELTALRRDRQVQYQAVAHLKYTVLKALWTTFAARHGWPEAPQTQRGRDFAAFLAQQGQLLQDFATFLALSDHWRQQGHPYLNWQDWPAAYHDPAGPAVAAFQQEQRRQILTHAYAQWLLAEQLAATQQQAQAQKLALGLYLDLAVGVNPGGFDTWRHQGLFAQGVDIGAPPDDFSPLGQNWRLLPLAPQALRAQGYGYFRDILRHNCPSGGLLRIDHVMGLFRLYWIPQGASAAQGAYVHYPADELLKILALESLRRQTAIIGEDLGTVEPAVRERLAAMQVFSTRLFYFERHEDGACRPAEQYPDRALAAITTHDLPTLAGFWQGRDIQVRQQMHLFPDEQTTAHNLAARRQFKMAILDLLSHQGWLTPEAAVGLADQDDLPAAVKWGVIAHLAATPCRLVLLSLEDICGWLDQQNLPGTKDEYPNWRLKLPLLLEDLAHAPEPWQAAQIMRQNHRGTSRTVKPADKEK